MFLIEKFEEVMKIKKADLIHDETGFIDCLLFHNSLMCFRGINGMNG